MRAIWKFKMPETDQVLTHEMPEGAEFLSIQEQGGEKFMWALVNPHSANLQIVKFFVIGTGWNFDEPSAEHLQTYQELGGALVWHLFAQRVPVS
jgi:hypothetical protein